MLLEILRAAVALAILAWLPGRAWRAAFLSEPKGLVGFGIDVAVSVAAVALAVFLAGSAFGVPVAAPTALWLALGITMLVVAVPISGVLSDRVLTDLS